MSADVHGILDECACVSGRPPTSPHDGNKCVFQHFGDTLERFNDLCACCVRCPICTINLMNPIEWEYSLYFSKCRDAFNTVPCDWATAVRADKCVMTLFSGLGEGAAVNMCLCVNMMSTQL